jgi:hypothetical protein
MPFAVSELKSYGKPAFQKTYFDTGFGHSRRDVTSLYAEGLLLKREAQPSSGLVE